MLEGMTLLLPGILMEVEMEVEAAGVMAAVQLSIPSILAARPLS